MNGTHEDRFRWYTWLPGSHHRPIDYYSAQVFKSMIDTPLKATLAELPNDEKKNPNAYQQVTGGTRPLKMQLRHMHDIYSEDKQYLTAHNVLKEQK